MTYLLVALAAGLSLGLQPLLLPLLRRYAVDVPNARSSHVVPTPRAGGIAVVAGALVALVLGPPAVTPVACGLVAFGVIGLAEDLCGVSVLPRFGLQLAAGAVTGWLALIEESTTLVVLPLVLLWLVAYVNAVNFMDGVNGISAGHTLVAGLAYAVLALLTDSPHELAGLVLAAAAAGFLPWNAVRARVFLGDVGSYGLGGALGVLAVLAVCSGAPVEAALAPLAVYLADTGATLLRRVRAGESWHRPHRTHVYQRLTDVGWSHQRVALAVAGLGAVVSGLGLVSLTGVVALRVVADVLVVGLLVAYLRLPSLLAPRQAALAVPSPRLVSESVSHGTRIG